MQFWVLQNPEAPNFSNQHQPSRNGLRRIICRIRSNRTGVTSA